MNIYSMIFFGVVYGCTVTVDKQSYDLTTLQDLGNISVTPPDDEVGEFSYEVSFCSDQVPCGSFQKGNMVRSTQGACDGIYGNWNSAENTKSVNGYVANFTGSQYCYDNFKEHFNCEFNFLCDPDAGKLGKLQAIKTGGNTCRYKVDIPTNLVCEGSTPIHGGGGGGGTGGLSGGSIFLIILLALVVIYVFAGFGLNYHKEKTVKAPHKSFWCVKLPYWTKTGCITSWLCTMGTYRWCCKKIFKTNPEDDKMATGLIDDGEGEDS